MTVCSLARSDEEAREGEGIAPYCARYEMARVRTPVQVLRMVARLPTPMPSSMGFFYSPWLAGRIRERLAAERFDLIFVHCSSVAQYVADVRGVPKILDFGDMDSQKWLEYARYKPFPLSVGYWLEGRKLEREERRLARRFDLCTATTRAEWETLAGYATGVATDWFPNGVDNEFFAPSTEPYDPDTICFVGRMDYYPNQECMFDFCARTLPLLRARRPMLKLLDRRRGPVARGAQARRTPWRHGHRVGARRPSLSAAVGAHDRAAQHRPRHPEQDPRSDGGRRAGRDEQHRSWRRGRARVGAFPGRALARASTRRRCCTCSRDPAERRRLAAAGRARMRSHHAWPSSMRRLDAIIERCLAMRARKPQQVLKRRV